MLFWLWYFSDCDAPSIVMLFWLWSFSYCDALLIVIIFWLWCSSDCDTFLIAMLFLLWCSSDCDTLLTLMLVRVTFLILMLLWLCYFSAFDAPVIVLLFCFWCSCDCDSILIDSWSRSGRSRRVGCDRRTLRSCGGRRTAVSSQTATSSSAPSALMTSPQGMGSFSGSVYTCSAGKISFSSL